MDVKCVPSPLPPLFHHLTCVRAPAAALEVLRVSDCPPKILLVLHIPPSPSASLPGTAPQHQAQGFSESIWGAPTFPGLVRWPDRHKYITHKLSQMLFQSVSAAAGLLVPKKGALVLCPLHPGRSLGPFHVPVVLQCFLSTTAGSSSSAYTEHSPYSPPQLWSLLLPLPGFAIVFISGTTSEALT